MVNLANSPFFKGGKGDLNQNFFRILLLTCNIPNSHSKYLYKDLFPADLRRFLFANAR
jgi:hypothetical protein